MLGNIFGDEFKTKEGETEIYMAPEFSGDLTVIGNHPGELAFVTDHSEGDFAFSYLRSIRMTTPYAGNGVGLQYPQHQSHRVLFVPRGNREFSVIGPAYWSDAEIIPKRDSPMDYRLTLPNATIYIKEDGEIIIEQTSDAAEVPIGGKSHVGIVANGDISIGSTGKIFIMANSDISIIGSATKLQGGGNQLSHKLHQHPVGNMGMKIPPAPEGTTETEAD